MKFFFKIFLVLVFSATPPTFASELSGYYKVLLTPDEEQPGWMDVTADHGELTYIVNACAFTVQLKPAGSGWVGLLTDDMDGVGCVLITKHAKVGDRFVEIQPLRGQSVVELFEQRILVPALASPEYFGRYYRLEE